MEKQEGQKSAGRTQLILRIAAAVITLALCLIIAYCHSNTQPVNIYVVTASADTVSVSGDIYDPNVPVKSPDVSSKATVSAADPAEDLPAGSVNINTASLEELQQLSGIGPVLAQRIIDYREENDGFDTVLEISSVEGIGEKIFGQIKDHISVQ